MPTSHDLESASHSAATSLLLGNETHYDSQQSGAEVTESQSGTEVTESQATPDVKELSYLESTHHMLKLAIPFTLSRLSVAVYSIGNGIILKQLGSDATAAGPLIISMTYGIVATSQAALGSTGILVGELNGAKKLTDIPQAVKQSWIMALCISIPALAILLNAKNLLAGAGIDENIASTVGDYFSAFSLGVIPLLLFTTDMQLALGVKRALVTMTAGSSYACLSMLFGYPLALGAFGLPKLGVAGLGYGASISGWLSFLALRAYYWQDKDFTNFHPINQSWTNGWSTLSKFFKIGLPMGLQSVTEWTNLLAISMIAGTISNETLQAEQASLMPMSAINIVLLGLAQATGVAISNAKGALDAAHEKQQHSPAQINIFSRNIKKLGYSGIGIGLTLSVVCSILFATMPQQIASAFIDTNDPGTSEDTLHLAKTLLLINGIGLLADSVRNLGAGALRGFKDVIYAPVISFVFMSAIGLSIGGTLATALDQSPSWLFITRDVGMLVSAALILKRWDFKSSNPAEQTSSTTSCLPCPC